MAVKRISVLDDLDIGTDVSKWQKPKRLKLGKGIIPKHVAFAYVKSSQWDWIDSAFQSHWDGFKADGVPRGAYHYFETDRPVGPQVDAMCRALEADAGELPPVCDQETADRVKEPARAADITLEFLLKLEEKLGVLPMLYSYSHHLKKHLKGQGHLFARYPLWLANYPTRYRLMAPKASKWIKSPKGWREASIWQISSKNPRWAKLRKWYKRDLDVNVARPPDLTWLLQGVPLVNGLLSPAEEQRAVDYNRRQDLPPALWASILSRSEGDWNVWNQEEFAELVAALQLRLDLDADGMVGPKTKRALEKLEGRKF